MLAHLPVVLVLHPVILMLAVVVELLLLVEGIQVGTLCWLEQVWQAPMLLLGVLRGLRLALHPGQNLHHLQVKLVQPHYSRQHCEIVGVSVSQGRKILDTPERLARGEDGAAGQ